MSASPQAPALDLRGRIVEEALRLFAERGFANTSMRQVAEAAGCTKPALYYHFGSKEDLFREAVATCFMSNEPLVQQARAAATDSRGQLVAFAEAMFDRVVANPVRMKLVLSMQNVADKAQPDVDLHAHHQRGIDLVADLIAEGRDRGELRADLDVHEAALILLGALHTRAWLALKGLTVPPTAPAHIVDLLLTGFNARPTRDGD